MDATTYKIDEGMPLRLSEELVKPDGNVDFMLKYFAIY